jgi:hypothetical protein
MWKTILVAIWAGLKPTLLSRKVQTGIIAMLCQLGAKYGLDFSTEAALAFVSPLFAAIFGQAAADMKKPQPCPKCAAPAPTPEPPAQDPPAS